MLQCNPHIHLIMSIHSLLPWLKQQLTSRARLLHEPILPRENTLTTQPSLPDHTLEGLILVRRDFIAEKHSRSLNLSIISTSHPYI